MSLITDADIASGLYDLAITGECGQGDREGERRNFCHWLWCYKKMQRGVKKKKKMEVGEEGSGGGEILVAVSTCNPAGTSLGQHMDFCPQTPRKLPQTLPGQKWGKSGACLSVALWRHPPMTPQISDAQGSLKAKIIEPSAGLFCVWCSAKTASVVRRTPCSAHLAYQNSNLLLYKRLAS